MKIVDTASRLKIIKKILDGDLNLALKSLSSEYEVSVPRFRVGTVKGYRNVTACYIERQKIIVFSNSEALRNPAVVLHEFYHHMVSSKSLKGGGTDKNADRFVKHFLTFNVRSVSIAD